MTQINYNPEATVFAFDIYHVLILSVVSYLIGTNVYHYMKARALHNEQKRMTESVMGKVADVFVQMTAYSPMIGLLSIIMDKVEYVAGKESTNKCDKEKENSIQEERLYRMRDDSDKLKEMMNKISRQLENLNNIVRERNDEKSSH